MLLKMFRMAVCLGAMATIVVTADAAPPPQAARNPAVDRLIAENAGARVSVNPATNVARFVRLPATAAAPAAIAQAKQDRAADFVNRYADAFGVRNGMADLQLRKTQTDSLGQTHLTWSQVYAGLPVFAGTLKAHFDSRGQLTVVNGTLTISEATNGLSADSTTQESTWAPAVIGARSILAAL